MTTPIPTLEEIKQMIFRLPFQEQMKLMEELEEKLETTQMMQLIDTKFNEVKREISELRRETNGKLDAILQRLTGMSDQG